MNVDSGILNGILSQIKTILGVGVSNVSPYAIGILWRICVIDLILAAFLNIGSSDIIKNLVSKILKYGAFYYLVDQWGSLLEKIIKGFGMVGAEMVPNNNCEGLFTDPSGIAGLGVKYAIDLVFQPATAIQLFTVEWLLNCKLFIALLIILCFAIIGLQLLCAYVEFYLVGTLNLILIPFGAIKYTSWIAQKASGSMLASGVKVMVCVFIAGVCKLITSNWIITNSGSIATLQTMIYLLLGSMGLTFLAWQIPKIVASMFAGSPQFNGNAPFAAAGQTAAQVGMSYVTGGASAAGAAAMKKATDMTPKTA